MKVEGLSFHAIRIEDNNSKSIRTGTSSKTQSEESPLQPYDGRTKDNRDDYVEVSNKAKGSDLAVKGDRDTCKKTSLFQLSNQISYHQVGGDVTLPTTLLDAEGNVGKRVIQATKGSEANVERISNLVETNEGSIRLDTGVVSLVDN